MTAGKYPLNGSHYTEADDLEMLSHPEDWPAVLHVRRDEPEESGRVEDWADERIVQRTTGGDAGRCIHYESTASMVADGWRVD